MWFFFPRRSLFMPNQPIEQILPTAKIAMISAGHVFETAHQHAVVGTCIAMQAQHIDSGGRVGWKRTK